MSEAEEQVAVVFVKRVYCQKCGAEARQWRTEGKSIRLPAVLPMAEVRSYLNGPYSQRNHPQHGGSIFAELEPVQ